jgi:hypothetical protein
VRSFLVVALATAGLAGCGGSHRVIAWSAEGSGEIAVTSIEKAGHGQYTATVDGVQQDDVPLGFTKGQIRELAELYRTNHVCELRHDPAYTPVADEGQTTLELDLEDLHCKVTLYDLEWEKLARPVTETMRSMRPPSARKPSQRKLDPRGASS